MFLYFFCARFLFYYWRSFLTTTSFIISCSCSITRASGISTSEGELGGLIPLPAGRELQELTEAFNRMSLRLKGHIDGLEGKVAERTSNLEKINGELSEALGKVKTLSGLLPICASCKKIRDDKGYWNQIEGYIQDHTDAAFSHGICPGCIETLYPERKK